MSENKFKVKVAMLEKCASIVDELNSYITSMQETYNEQSAIPEEERSWRFYDAQEYPAKIAAYKQIISHLEKLL